jgi:hypothetical protein
MDMDIEIEMEKYSYGALRCRRWRVFYSIVSIAHHQVPVVRLRLVLRFPLSLFPGGRPLVALPLLASPVLFPGDGAVVEAEVAVAGTAAVVPTPLTAGAAEVEASPPPVRSLDEAPAAFAELVSATVATEEEFIVLLSTVARLVAVFEVAVSRQGRFCPTTGGALVQRFVPLLPPEFDGCKLGNDEEGGGGRGPE